MAKNILNTQNKFFFIEKETKKYQIMVYNTGRSKDLFYEKLKNRNCGKYHQTPHYLIDIKGNIDNLIPEMYYSDILDNASLDNKVISVCLENLGWLRKSPETNNYINWIGDIYNGDVSEKKWRNHIFWANYTDKQYKSLKDLLKKICERNDIPYTSPGHNVKIDGVESICGVVSKSNYAEKWTDVNPSFEFDKIFP